MKNRIVKFACIFLIAGASAQDFSEQEIRAAVERASPGINALYERSLVTKDQKGCVNIEMKIALGGTMEYFKVLEASFSNEAFFSGIEAYAKRAIKFQPDRLVEPQVSPYMLCFSSTPMVFSDGEWITQQQEIGGVSNEAWLDALLKSESSNNSLKSGTPKNGAP